MRKYNIYSSDGKVTTTRSTDELSGLGLLLVVLVLLLVAMMGCTPVTTTVTTDTATVCDHGRPVPAVYTHDHEGESLGQRLQCLNREWDKQVPTIKDISSTMSR